MTAATEARSASSANLKGGELLDYDIDLDENYFFVASEDLLCFTR